ncbi:MAG TPA: dihydrofolate reductase [Chitinophagaceae bacterium]|jgi:dihydrofolate reductase|nr:dihydrofolate reductase [Chitinophagaceae bacterium]
MKLSIIVAATENNVIGKNNQMLWNLPEDMRFFKNTTWGFPIIMGRKTYEALSKKPLAGRFNIVISRQPGYKSGNPEVQEAGSLLKAIELAKKLDAKEAFIGGGGQIYKESILLCDAIYMTRVFTNLEGDAFFPEIPTNIFQLTYSKKVPADDRHAYAMDFQTWTKIKSIPEHTS